MTATVYGRHSDWMWLHGGKGNCQLCGAETKHGALLTSSERGGKLFVCRDCALKVRSQIDDFLTRATEALD